jgi:hypothetical protein
MERDWSLSGACHGLQSRDALHNPGCAIRQFFHGSVENAPWREQTSAFIMPILAVDAAGLGRARR